MTPKEEILAVAEAQLSNLRAIESEILAKIDAVKNETPDDPLSDEQKKRIDDLYDKEKPVLASIAKISLVTAQKLDKLGELKALADQLAKVTKDLNDRAAEIAAIGTAAAKVGTICTAINGLIPKLTNLVTG